MDKIAAKPFLFSRKYQVLRHIIFWIVVLSGITITFGVYMHNLRQAFITTLAFIPTNIFYTYGLLLWLMPAYLLKKRYVLFFVLFVIWIFCGQLMLFLTKYYIILPAITGQWGILGNVYSFDVFDWFQFIVVNTIATAAIILRMFRYWFNDQEQKLKLAKEKLEAELQLLKSELHPHFLFNTLNNLYSLVYEKSDNAPAMLLRLSGLLSYVLYECKSNEVMLDREITVIRDYVSLEQQRYGDRLDVSLNFSGNIDDVMITPMLFQPFIENAFKHGTSEQIGKAWISIDLSVKSGQLVFKVINSCDEKDPPGVKGGIGINNVRKRLELLYPSRFQLECGKDGDVYIVSLSIELNVSSPKIVDSMNKKLVTLN